MSALDRRGDVIRALSATGEWKGIEWERGKFTHKHKTNALLVHYTIRGGVYLCQGAAVWTVYFTPSVPDAVVLAACTAAAAEAEQ